MRYQLRVSGDGIVVVVLDDDLPLMGEALEDSLSTSPPTGASQDGPSTYRLDRAISYLVGRMQDGGSQPIAEGNATYLRLRAGNVEARYVYDPEDSSTVDTIPADEFLTFLQEWRKRVLDESPNAAQRQPPPRQARPMPPA
jgi:hypothetical protein